MKKVLTTLTTALILFGLSISTYSQAGQQILLGERHVSDRTEKDSIHVGKARGKFSTLQVKAKKAAVEFKRMVIHFENGETQTLSNNIVVGKNKSSRRIKLNGAPRFIDKVVLTYEARTAGWKGADMKLFGTR